MKRYELEELVNRTILTVYEGGEPVDYPVRVVTRFEVSRLSRAFRLTPKAHQYLAERRAQ